MQSRGRHVQAGDVIPYVMCKVNVLGRTHTESFSDVFTVYCISFTINYGFRQNMCMSGGREGGGREGEKGSGREGDND